MASSSEKGFAENTRRNLSLLGPSINRSHDTVTGHFSKGAREVRVPHRLLPASHNRNWVQSL